MLILLVSMNIHAYQSEDKIKGAILGKVAKFVKWDKSNDDEFVITVLGDSFGETLDKMYDSKKIKSKKIKLVYIDNIDELKFTNILYIPIPYAPQLNEIIQKTKGKNILTVSTIKGFADKKGVLQIYFISQKAKLKINLDSAKKNHLKINSSLLRIADVIKENR